MIVLDMLKVYRNRNLLQVSDKLMESRRMKIYYRSGALKPMPVVNSFGVLGVFLTVIPGLLIGAVISKNIASFLEENDLFIPDDEDDD